MSDRSVTLLKDRTFSELFDDLVFFIRENSIHFFKVILALVGPLALVSASMNAYYSTRILNNPFIGMDVVFSPLYYIMLLFSLVTYLLMIGVVINYMKLYEQRQGPNFTIKEVWEGVMADIGRLLSAFFMLALAGILVGFLLGAIFYGLFAAGGGILGALLALAMLLALMTFGPQIAFFINAIYFVMLRDKKGFSEGASEAWNLTYSKFWWTWVIMVVGMLFLVVLSMIFNLPSTVIQGFSAMSSLGDPSTATSLALIVTSTLGTFLTSIAGSLNYLLVGFHYYSTLEHTTGEGLSQKVEEFGQSGSYRDSEER